MHTEPEADASVTEEFIALTKASQIKRKDLEWERSGNEKGPNTRERSRNEKGPDTRERSEKEKVITRRSKKIEIEKHGGIK